MVIAGIALLMKGWDRGARAGRVSDDGRMPTRRAPIFGPEPWAIQAGRTWSHWDLWFCVAAVRGGGDLGTVEAGLVSELRRPSPDLSRASEGKLSHLADLRARLDAAGLTAADLAGAAVHDAKIVEKAQRKIAADLEGRALTETMRETPRVRLQRRARFGSWDALPVSPVAFYGQFRPLLETDRHLPKGRTFAVTRRLTERLRRLDALGRPVAERIALYRAFHTAGLELADHADDSYGNIGQLRQPAWQTYLRLAWRTAGIGPELWWRDLCELIVWEPYAPDYQHETLPYESARADEVPLIESILTGLAAEHDAVHLRWQADEARQQVAWLHVSQRRYDEFPRVATLLGSEHWEPIDAMARAAITGEWREIAVEVFQAADQPGFHQGHLRRLCRELTGVWLGDEDLAPRPALRVVS